MKVLILVGYETRLAEMLWEGNHRLARVWQDKHYHIHVQALAPEYKVFAREVQRLIEERLRNPKTPIFCMTGWHHTAKDGMVTYTDAIHISHPEDADFLDTLQGDTVLWGGAKGKDVAGYQVHTGASEIVEE